MRTAIVYLLRHQFLGLLALLLVVGGYADAATGGRFILGNLNQAGTTSVLQNTGTGAALSLKVAKGQPPLAVNSSEVVDGLNAELLNGHSDNDFMGADDAYTKDEADARYLRKTAKWSRTIKGAYSDDVAIPASTGVVSAVALCPAGYRVISGGAEIGGTATAYLVQSFATIVNGTDGWKAVAVNPPGIHFAGTLLAQVICSQVGKPVVP